MTLVISSQFNKLASHIYKIIYMFLDKQSQTFRPLLLLLILGELAMAGFELGMLRSKSKRSIVLAWSLNCYTDAAVDPINSSYMFRSQQRE